MILTTMDRKVLVGLAYSSLLVRHLVPKADGPNSPQSGTGDYFLERSFAPSGRSSPVGETWRYSVCRVIPSSLQRAPTLVSF